MDHIDDQRPRSHAAIAQLEKALQRLETVVTKGRHGDLFVEQELKAVRDDNARLDESSRLVEERLDMAINRLRAVLED